ncbi:MAG: hypothetical protein AB3P25_05085 [Candidatus Liberibacter psyllaurous]
MGEGLRAFASVLIKKSERSSYECKRWVFVARKRSGAELSAWS